MPKSVDVTSAYGMLRFYKAPPKRLGLWGTLVLSNLLWILILATLVTTIWSLSKFTRVMTSNYLHEKWSLSQIKQLTAKQLAERDMQITRLIAYQSSSPMDVLSLGRKISKVLDSAPARHRKFFEEALPEAMQVQIMYGIPASAVVAMSIYESAYGRSSLAKDYHNYFGIKAFSNWHGPKASSVPTRDEGVPTTADFRAYSNMHDGFLGYAQFLKESGRYDHAFKTKSGAQFVATILKAGYCPDSSYLPNIKRIMENHQLQELDEILETTTQKPLQMASYKP
ncbi:MAG: glucosaminidase domain-containing protein [bacterium]